MKTTKYSFLDLQHCENSYHQAEITIGRLQEKIERRDSEIKYLKKQVKEFRTSMSRNSQRSQNRIHQLETRLADALGVQVEELDS